MAIHIYSCAELETIVVKTRSSVYELVVLRGDRGDVLLRGGKHASAVPRHPACEAATTRPERCAVRMGAQSATWTATTRSAAADTTISASGVPQGEEVAT